MKYTFISEKMAEKIKKEFEVDLKSRPDVIITKRVLKTNGWICVDCDCEIPKLKRCSCGSYNIKTRQEPSHYP